MATLYTYVVVFSTLLGLITSTSLTFELEENTETCFHEEYSEGGKYRLDFSVLRGGNMDIDVSIKSSSGNTIHGSKKERENSFVFFVGKGVYSFCFSNTFSTITDKVVYMNIRPNDQETLAQEAGMKGFTVQTQVESSLEEIHRYSSAVVKYQILYRHNEKRGRYQAEKLNTHIQWWSIGEALVILTSGVGQIIILRNLFHVKSRA